MKVSVCLVIGLIVFVPCPGLGYVVTPTPRHLRPELNHDNGSGDANLSTRYADQGKREASLWDVNG